MVLQSASGMDLIVLFEYYIWRCKMQGRQVGMTLFYHQRKGTRLGKVSTNLHYTIKHQLSDIT